MPGLFKLFNPTNLINVGNISNCFKKSYLARVFIPPDFKDFTCNKNFSVLKI